MKVIRIKKGLVRRIPPDGPQGARVLQEFDGLLCMSWKSNDRGELCLWFTPQQCKDMGMEDVIEEHTLLTPGQRLMQVLAKRKLIEPEDYERVAAELGIPAEFAPPVPTKELSRKSTLLELFQEANYLGLTHFMVTSFQKSKTTSYSWRAIARDGTDWGESVSDFDSLITSVRRSFVHIKERPKQEQS